MAKSEDTSNIEKLVDTESFQIWKFQLSILFRANELFEVVTKSTTAAERDSQWLKKDANAQKLIVTTVEKKPLMHLLNCRTAHEIWTRVCAIYERDNEQQKCSLFQTFYSLAYDKNTDISTYISKLKNTATRLSALDTKISDEMMISKILATLPEEFKHFASAWDSTSKTEKTLDNLTTRLIAEEMRITDRQTEESTVAFKVTNKKCSKCSKQGHLTKDCTERSQSYGKDARCFKCNKIGHIARFCKEKQKGDKTCSICKKSNHKDRDCYFRKGRGNKEDKTE